MCVAACRPGGGAGRGRWRAEREVRERAAEEEEVKVADVVYSRARFEKGPDRDGRADILREAPSSKVVVREREDRRTAADKDKQTGVHQ